MSASGRTGDPSPAKQECISVPSSCSYESVSGLPEWLSRDPIQEAGGINLYGYVGGEPVARIDQDGLDALFLIGRNHKDPSLFQGARKVAKEYEKQHPGQKATVCEVRDFQDVSNALQNTPNIDRLDYWGHGANNALFTGDAGNGVYINHPTQSVANLPTQNVKPGAQINLMSCNGANGANSIAQAFADHFNATTSGFTGDTLFPFGIPMGNAATVQPGQTTDPGPGVSTWPFGMKK